MGNFSIMSQKKVTLELCQVGDFPRAARLPSQLGSYRRVDLC